MTIVAVNFMTYTPSLEHPRVQYSRTCLENLLKRLKFAKGQLIWHIADDGSPEGHVEALVAICRSHGIEPTLSNSNHRGYGANMNMATQVIHDLCDFVIPIEEDWELVREFDISDLVAALEHSQLLNEPEDPDFIQCIRLGYLGWSNKVPGTLVQWAHQTFFKFDPNGLETHVFAGHPRLESKAFEISVGAWPEGIRPGYTEMEVCNRPASRIGVAWPMDAGINASQDYANLFAHIGNVQA